VARNTTYHTEDNVPIPNMGSRLHELFGEKHLVAGFAFNQGSFQARSSSGELLKHSVWPRGEGSFESVLAGTGHPMFLLNLTSVPAAGPVSDWLATAPASRWVGAVYDANRPEAYERAADPRRDYDLLVFVESTSAARPNRSRNRPQKANAVLAKGPMNLELL